MSTEQDILAALRALADADRGTEAAPELEAKLRLAFRANARERRLKRIAAWTLAAAAVLVAMLVGYDLRPRPEKARVAVTTVDSAPVAASTPVVLPPVQRLQRVRRALPREVFTDFFPLVDVAPPIERGELVRVSLSAAAMQAVGLPVREDRLSERVQADVLVSEEGLATAIRFVKYSQ
jgi:hypothetical protein